MLIWLPSVQVKVFWTAMSKWYQGKVVAYDPATAKHKVSFRDGEQNEYLLQQEALVWLDIPELSSDAALKKMRSEEGEPVAIIRYPTPAISLFLVLVMLHRGNPKNSCTKDTLMADHFWSNRKSENMVVQVGSTFTVLQLGCKPAQPTMSCGFVVWQCQAERINCDSLVVKPSRMAQS